MPPARQVRVRPLLPGYAEAYQAQLAEADAVLAMSGEDTPVAGTLFLGEHDHVYTLGKHGDDTNMLIPEAQLQTLGIPLVRTDRGGDITYHGPGQLVGYPILHLPSLNLGARAYIATLQQTVIDALAVYGLSGMVDPHAAGVWLESSGGRPLRKICAMGVRISRSVTMHGFALNLNTDLSHFARINPCGFVDRGVTSLQQELGQPVDMATFRTHFLESFARCFHVEILL
ncbi:MAG: lipoate--protein ligase [Bacteroidetes bacterium]|nr:MAG: lipoate--protein ligase [Bacteroidota bacterium]